MANSADPDQLASSEANWSGSSLFAKAGYIWVQQDKGWWVPTTYVYLSYPEKNSVSLTIIFAKYVLFNTVWRSSLIQLIREY